MKFSATILALLSTAVCALSASAQTQPPPPARPSPQKTTNLSSAVGLNELKIEMAESRLKLGKSPKVVSDLASALEEYLTTTCMAKLPRTLSYAGNPTDPICLERLRRLLEINPGNPVAICVQDGITAPSCVDASKNQTVSVVYENSTDEEVDPVLKAGLSAATLERIRKVEESLKEIDVKYQEVETPEEKRTLVNDATTLYDQILHMACKVSAVALKTENKSDTFDEPQELAQTRARLLQIPPAIRGDYQREMSAKIEKELSDPKASSERQARLKELLDVVKDPTSLSSAQIASLKRVRFILNTCSEKIELARQVSPDLPGVTCYREGWYTPQCVYAMKKWRMQKQQEGAKVTGTPSPKSSMISTF
jgi:hypothetical protein